MLLINAAEQHYSGYEGLIVKENVLRLFKCQRCKKRREGENKGFPSPLPKLYQCHKQKEESKLCVFN